jgi:alkanesulfonate monooxygenase SsuD/methylene tetrahydromethanopterin reductase-like flavin-dependent oxidoreductase (luciferase family)
MISNGRLILGIGAGWNQEEMENHGANYQHRWKIVREKVLAMKAIWTEDEAEFHGDFVDFDPIWSWPKPVQAGGPAIWMGANSKWVFDRVAEYCDGWMPIGGSGSGGMANMKAALTARGRNIDDLPIALFGSPMDVEQARGRIDQGFTDLIFSLPQSTPDRVMTRLDEIARIVEQLRVNS